MPTNAELSNVLRIGARHHDLGQREVVLPDAPSQSIVDTYMHYLRTKIGHTAVRTVQAVGHRLGTL